MGEPHRQLSPTAFIHERQLKFREIAEGTVVAIAGDGPLALTMTDFIEDHIRRLEKPADVFPLVEATFGPFHPARRVQILLIQGTVDGDSTIIKWDTHGGREDATHWAHIGSLAPERVNQMATLFQRIVAERGPSKDAMLLAGMAFVMSKSQHNDLIRENVGGIVCGVRVQRGKTIWPDDLVIVQHRRGTQLLTDGRISLHARRGIVYINSTHHSGSGTVLMNAHSSVRTADLMDEWHRESWPYLRGYLREHFTTCTRWLFINLDHDVPLVFVVHGRLEETSGNLRFMPVEKGGHTVVLDGDLAKTMQREIPSSGGGELRILEWVDFSKPLPDGINPKEKSA
jgi:hypothetical protein